MKTFFGGIAMAVLFILGIIQFAALSGFFYNWFGGYMFIAVIIASFVTSLPLLATILGICGAVYAWDMNILLAIILFCPLLVIYIPMLLGIPLALVFDKIRNLGKNI